MKESDQAKLLHVIARRIMIDPKGEIIDHELHSPFAYLRSLADAFSTENPKECSSEQPLGGGADEFHLELCDTAVRDDFIKFPEIPNNLFIGKQFTVKNAAGITGYTPNISGGYCGMACQLACIWTAPNRMKSRCIRLYHIFCLAISQAQRSRKHLHLELSKRTQELGYIQSQMKILREFTAGYWSGRPRRKC